MESGLYIRFFGIVAGENRHRFGFESHPPHRPQVRRNVLTCGNVVFPLLGCHESVRRACIVVSLRRFWAVAVRTAGCDRWQAVDFDGLVLSVRPPKQLNENGHFAG